MANPTLLRLILLPLLPAALFAAAHGAEGLATPPPKTVDYKRTDALFYTRADVLHAAPGAVILDPSAFAQNGDTYTYAPRKQAPEVLYLETHSDWIEPITPPDMPASLNIAPDAMQIREPQGDVQAAMPNAPATFAPVTDGMTLPNGAVIKTGPNSTAAVLFGGVASARLMPGSEAAVQQTVAPQSRSAEIDLTAGGVFSKIGTQPGVSSEYQVHTPFGNAIAQAGDFAAVVTGESTDVWVAQGTVDLLQPDGRKFGSVAATGAGPLRRLRYPAYPPGVAGSSGASALMETDARTFTALLNFIPMANQKLAALHAKEAKGTPLTANEQAYLARIKQVPAVIMLRLVEPPAPPPAPIAVAPPAPPAPPAPLTVVLAANGSLHFKGAILGLEEFQTRLKALLAAQPDQALVLKASTKAPYGKFQAVVASIRSAPVKDFSIAQPEPQPPAPAPPPAPPVAATPPAPVPAPVIPVMPALPAAPAVPAVPAEPAIAAAPPANPVKPAGPPKPLTVLVHQDGTVGFQGKRSSLTEFRSKVKAMVKATPDRELVIKAGPKVNYDRVKAVLDICADAQVSHVTAPTPPSLSASPVVTAIPAKPAAPEPPPVVLRPSAAEGTPGLPEIPPLPAPANAPEAAPAANTAVNDAPVPAALTLDAAGNLTLDGAPITEDELKGKLAELAKTNPKNPLVLTKQPKVTRAQWQHYVALCHSMKLRLLVKNAPASAADAAPPEIASTPPVPRPAAGEGSPSPAPAIPAVPVDGNPAPHLAAMPMTEDPVPVEIELTPDGQISFLGETVTEDELRSRLDGVAKNNPTEPILVLKDEKVRHDQLEKVVTLCHEAKLKVRVKTVKSSDSSSAMAPHKAAAPAVAATGDAPSPERILPVEIGLATDGQTTLDGSKVGPDNLQLMLAAIAKANPRQPVVIVKEGDVAPDKLDAVVAVCRSVNLPLKVKEARLFSPPPPPVAADDSASEQNLPTPAVHMHPPLGALSTDAGAAPPAATATTTGP
ncbi:MAG: biopolymer transporter ExbD [Verrucomicrobiota bacterium]